MKSEYKEAFEEIYEIFNLMPKELLNKIPTKFYEMIEEERDTNYFPNVHEPLEKQKLKNETIIILGLIYRDFLCSPDEKKRLQEKDEKELQEIEKALEKEKRQKYNDIFKNKNNQIAIKETKPKETTMVEYKEKNFLQKIFDKIKHLFKKC